LQEGEVIALTQYATLSFINFFMFKRPEKGRKDINWKENIYDKREENEQGSCRGHLFCDGNVTG
jgi:hypothetical protein